MQLDEFAVAGKRLDAEVLHAGTGEVLSESENRQTQDVSIERQAGVEVVHRQRHVREALIAGGITVGDGTPERRARLSSADWGACTAASRGVCSPGAVGRRRRARDVSPACGSGT